MYRRYRPETFAEVIGQDHVTTPLRAALANNRVNHAYLFSGPRGCGKTTSARILARALNCERAPVADPCGECDSCRDLARGGPGSIDVIEIDAASHGGVDDARDLREKAFFAPVRSRYKVYVIDEAHMVTTQGFNALLKLVEEPPPHLRFIFATTEPDKVIPTIRSRTHHYPFRLIPPRLLTTYLTDLCQREGVAIEPAALPLVVRAGGGSARDTLSVLDQLLGGAGPEGVTHQLATDLLGYTPDTLLDEVVEAFAAGDGAAVFGVVDKVVETGQDPRRFTEDLLRRLRDLVIVDAVPDAPATGLIDVSEDQGERLVAQAARFGGVELSRAADLVAAGLTEMRGATAPRLLLELVCARVLLPGADDTDDGVLARLDRLEKRLAIPGGAPAPAAPAAVAPAVPAAATRSEAPAAPVAPAAPPSSARPEPAAPAAPPPDRPSEGPVAPAAEAPAPSTPSAAPAAPAAAGAAAPAGAPTTTRPDSSSPTSTSSGPPAPSAPADEQPAAAGPAPAAPAGGLTLVDVRRLWPDIVEATKARRRVTWMHLTQHAQVVSVDAGSLVLGFDAAGPRDHFAAGGHAEIVRQAAIDVVGVDWRIEAITDPGVSPGAAAPAAAPAGGATGSSPAAAPAPAPTERDAPIAGDRGAPAAAPPAEPPGWATTAPGGTPVEPAAPATPATPAGEATAAPDRPSASAEGIAHARAGIQQTREAGRSAERDDDRAAADADAHPDDMDAETDGLAGAELLQRELGAQVIEEIPHR
nr:DNA polymerase III subunit gamma and tau [Nocardioides perillae]